MTQTEPIVIRPGSALHMPVNLDNMLQRSHLVSGLMTLCLPPLWLLAIDLFKRHEVRL